jgi:flagella basal body P-ring formation protein FlgA
MKIFIVLFIIIFTFYSKACVSEENSQVFNAVKEYLLSKEINKEFNFSKKVRLPHCKEDLIINKKFNSFKTLEVNCPQNNSWSYNIRINIKNFKLAKIKKNKVIKKNVNLIKVKNNINKGQVIRLEDLVFEKTRSPGSSNYFTNKEDILGRKAKVSIRKGQIIRIRHIEKDWLIKEGQKVIIENTRFNIHILVDGIALKSAIKDEYTDVLNKSNGKIVKAWVKNNKKVSVFR